MRTMSPTEGAAAAVGKRKRGEIRGETGRRSEGGSENDEECEGERLGGSERGDIVTLSFGRCGKTEVLARCSLRCTLC